MDLKKTEIEENAVGWLMTFGDMMTLIMTFFVLLFSMSTLDPVKMAQMGDAMSEATGRLDEKVTKPMASMNEIKESLNTIVSETDMKNEATISRDPRGVSVELKGDASFATGSTELHPKMEQLLDKMIPELLNNINDLRTVIVEGHSDNQTISGVLAEKYPTNWELSSARASVVVNKIIEQSIEFADKGIIDSEYADGRISGRLTAAGYADQWPADIGYEERRGGYISKEKINKLNSTLEMMTKNRRIKIIYSRQ